MCMVNKEIQCLHVYRVSCNFFDLPVVKSSWELKRLVALVAREFGALAGGRG